MNFAFNILDFFDDKIDNLDLTKNYIYVLKLVDDKYYIGRTSNILKRMEQHFTGCGAKYTNKFKPIKVIEVIEEFTIEDERNKTLEFMEKYGWENVRGSAWCSIEIKKPNIKNKKLNIKNKKPEATYSNDDIIKELYCEQNKNIIEISEILDLSPGLISFRLEKLNVVNRRQLTKGYFEYIESDLYNLYIEKRKKRREERKEKKESHKIIMNDINNEQNEIHLKNIKQRIREKIMNANCV